jgi:3-oxoacyl-[acyl-carrier-protein] synthase II
MTGHLCGVIDLITSAPVVVHGVVPPTVNCDTTDPAYDLDDVPNVAREMRVSHVLSTSFGFGDGDACMAIGALARSVDARRS